MVLSCQFSFKPIHWYKYWSCRKSIETTLKCPKWLQTFGSMAHSISVFTEDFAHVPIKHIFIIILEIPSVMGVGWHVAFITRHKKTSHLSKTTDSRTKWWFPIHGGTPKSVVMTDFWSFSTTMAGQNLEPQPPLIQDTVHLETSEALRLVFTSIH